MIDALRKLDWAPRSVHRKARAVAAVCRKSSADRRDARDVEIAEAWELALDEYHSIVQDAASCAWQAWMMRLPRLRRTCRPVPRSSGREIPGCSEPRNRGLPERERLVMSLYYSDGLNLKEIGAVLKVTESRVCQLHGQALVRLKARLADWRDGSVDERRDEMKCWSMVPDHGRWKL